MRRLLIALLAPLVLAAPAAAQEAKGVVVARHGDAELRAFDQRGSLCLGVHAKDEGGIVNCSEPPSGRFEATLSTLTGERHFVGGAVPAGTASVEVEFARGGLARVATIAGAAYEGRHRGKVTFFIADTAAARSTPGEEPVLIRMFDGAGKLVGAAEGGYEHAPIAGPLPLLSRGGIRVHAEATRAFEPSLLRIDRLARHVCLAIERVRGGGSSGGGCAGTGPAHPGLTLQTQSDCGRATIVHGFTAPNATAVEITLGTGRRLRAATQDVSSLGTAARAVVLVVPRDMAMRGARALDAAGRELGHQPIGSAPGGRRCGRYSGSGSSFGIASFDADDSALAPPDGQQVAAGAAPGARLMVRDEVDDHLCVGVDGLAEDRHDCVVPRPSDLFPSFHYPEFDVDASAARTAVGGILPPDATGVRVQLDGRRKVTAAISDGGEYSGRYRGVLRFFLAEAPGRHRVTAVEVLDRDGKVAVSVPGPGLEPPPMRTLARGRGFRVVGLRWKLPFKFPGMDEEQTVRCIGLAIGSRKPEPEHCEEFDSPGAGIVGRVACSPRLGVLMGRQTKGLHGVRLTTAGGKTLRSRTVRVPRSLGGGRIWVVAIPAKARVVRMRFLGRRPRERFGPPLKAAGAYDVDAPARQCGYALPEPTF